MSENDGLRIWAGESDVDVITGYLLSKKEDRVGSPEKPLSGLGEVTYKKYWQLTVFRYLKDATGSIGMDGECNRDIVVRTYH